MPESNTPSGLLRRAPRCSASSAGGARDGLCAGLSWRNSSAPCARSAAAHRTLCILIHDGRHYRARTRLVLRLGGGWPSGLGATGFGAARDFGRRAADGRGAGPASGPGAAGGGLRRWAGGAPGAARRRAPPRRGPPRGSSAARVDRVAVIAHGDGDALRLLLPVLLGVAISRASSGLLKESPFDQHPGMVMSRMTTNRARLIPRSYSREWQMSEACVAQASAMFSASQTLPGGLAGPRASGRRPPSRGPRAARACRSRCRWRPGRRS
jgi:hypothetical protein